MNKEKIFISIAAFEDPGLIQTMNNALGKATNPDRISFGLALNYKTEPSFEMFKNKISIVRDSDFIRPGIVRMRSEIRNLIDDEEYFLSIDAHTDFLRGWDSRLIDDFKTLSEIKKDIILSKPIQTMSQSDKFVKTEFSMHGVWGNFGITPTQKSFDEKDLDMLDPGYFLNHWISCNFMFLRVDSLERLNIPGYHAFPWEEFEQTLVAYCHGFDVLCPGLKNTYVFIDYDGKYDFPYDEDWWEFRGTDRDNPSHWKRRWVLDPVDVKIEVEKFMLTGKNKYYSLNENAIPVIEFYNKIGVLEKYLKILCDGYEQGFAVNSIAMVDGMNDNWADVV
jgi:hypothetical protein